MTTIRSHVEAMGVDSALLEDADEYFEVVQTLTVGAVGTPVKDQADLIHPGNDLLPGDLIQIRRRIGKLSDQVVDPVPPAVWSDPAAVMFDGAQQKVAHAALNLTASFSLAARYRVDGQGSVGDKTYATIFGYSGSRRLLVNATTGALLAQVGGANVTANGVATGTEAHIAYVWDFAAAVQKLYLNGAEVASVATTGGPTWVSAWWEGAYGEPSINYSLKGQLRNRAAYNFALTPQQAATLAAA